MSFPLLSSSINILLCPIHFILGDYSAHTVFTDHRIPEQFLLTSIFLLQVAATHDGDGDFEGEDSYLAGPLAAETVETGTTRGQLGLPIIDVEQPVEGEIKAQRNIHCGRVGSLQIKIITTEHWLALDVRWNLEIVFK